MDSKVWIQWCLLILQLRASDLPMTLVETFSSFRGRTWRARITLGSPLPTDYFYPFSTHPMPTDCLYSFSTHPADPQLLLLSSVNIYLLTHNSGENLLLHQKPCLLQEPLLWWRTTCQTKGYAQIYRTLASNLDRNILLDQRLPQTSKSNPQPRLRPSIDPQTILARRQKRKQIKGTKNSSNKDKQRNQHLDL